MSPNEMRVKAFEANKAGNAQEYVRPLSSTVGVKLTAIEQVSFKASQIGSAENTFNVRIHPLLLIVKAKYYLSECPQ